MYTIYKIRNVITGWSYIGCSKQLKQRVRYHFYCLRTNRHVSPLMQEEYNSLGEQSFEVVVIAHRRDKRSAYRFEKKNINDGVMLYNKIGNSGWKSVEHRERFYQRFYNAIKIAS